MAEEPTLHWEVSTGYDFFTSLDVLHDPDRYGLRGSWAAGVRSRLPVEQRDLLQTVKKRGNVWMLPWLAKQEGPKDSQSILQKLSMIPPAEILPTFLRHSFGHTTEELLFEVADKQTYTSDDVENLRSLYQAMYREEGIKKKITTADLEETLTIWTEVEKYGEGLLTALKTYYEVFFSEEEKRILPALEKTVVHAKKVAEKLPLEGMLNDLSQGIRYEMKNTEAMQSVLMVPSFWTTPLSLFTSLDKEKHHWLFMFGGRPANISLVPGETVPELLNQTLKALADPTRLRILRYLAKEPLAPAELARRLRLRPPTVIHHLDSLRLARLVHVTLNHEGRRYEARREAIDAAFKMLDHFLDG